VGNFAGSSPGAFSGNANAAFTTPFLQAVQQLLQQGSGRPATFDTIPIGSATAPISLGIPDFWRQLEAALTVRNTATGRAYDPHGLLAAQPIPPTRGDGGHEPLPTTNAIGGMLSRHAGQTFGSQPFFDYYAQLNQSADPNQRKMLSDALSQAGQMHFSGQLPGSFANFLRGFGSFAGTPAAPSIGGGSAPTSTSFLPPGAFGAPTNNQFR
jgi:hypothetical protein